MVRTSSLCNKPTRLILLTDDPPPPPLITPPPPPPTTTNNNGKQRFSLGALGAALATPGVKAVVTRADFTAEVKGGELDQLKKVREQMAKAFGL